MPLLVMLCQSLHQNLKGVLDLIVFGCCSCWQAPDQLKLSHLTSTADPICAVTAHQHLLLVGRASGIVHAFSLPALNMEGQYVLPCRCGLLVCLPLFIHSVLSCPGWLAA